MQAPASPGVYIFKDSKNRALYIGKAANLANRLASYASGTETRSRILAAHAADVDMITTNSDVEALTLEESLIKLNKPKYNIRLKDDKKFPYLKITIQEDFPRVFYTRDLKDDGSLLFGPYTNARALRQTRDALCRIFKIVSCTKDLAKKYTRGCLEYYIGKCSGPCIGQIGKEDYRNLVARAVKFLKGNADELIQAIEEQMWALAKKENFEAAKTLRDQLLAIRKITQRQQMVTKDNISRDIIGVARSRFTGVACLFRIRENRLISKELYHLKINASDRDDEIVSAFIRLIYLHISFLPEEINVPREPDQKNIQLRWFREKGFSVKIEPPRGENELRLINWAKKNAELELARVAVKKSTAPVIMELQNILALEKPPRWIEAFDISNLKEKFAVGSSVAFKDGLPDKQRYRRYRIKRVKGQNDFAMMREIVFRRLKDLTQQEEKEMPDLLLIDGGRGQQSAVLSLLKQIRIDIPVFAIAKRSDELVYPNGNSISIPTMSRSVILLKRLRDEAHRFAIGYHRKVRGKEFIASALDTITGIGRLRRVNLLNYFGSLDALRKASEEEIAKAPGIGLKTARVIYESLHT